jgi:hypothetical protein
LTIRKRRRGIIYFVHQFKPTEREAALLDDPEMLAAVTAINRQIHTLAPVLNSPSMTNAIAVTSSPPETPIAHMVKRHNGATYIFAAAMRNQPTRATFKIGASSFQSRAREQAVPSKASAAEVLGESRRAQIRDGEFADDFQPYDVHLYQIPD